MNKGLLKIIATASLATGLVLAEPTINYAADYPAGMITKGNKESTHRRFSGSVLLKRLPMPDGEVYEIYSDKDALYGFNILPPRRKEKISVDLNGKNHETEGDRYELKKISEGVKWSVKNQALASVISSEKKLKIKLKNSGNGIHTLMINGEPYEHFNSRTINGHEFLTLENEECETGEQLKWIYVPLSDLKLDITNEGGIRFENKEGISVARKIHEEETTTKEKEGWQTDDEFKEIK